MRETLKCCSDCMLREFLKTSEEEMLPCAKALFAEHLTDLAQTLRSYFSQPNCNIYWMKYYLSIREVLETFSTSLVLSNKTNWWNSHIAEPGRLFIKKITL